MGIIDNIKDFYFELEDGYYKLLDSADARGVPVYAIIDPLDKAIPSFAIVFLLALILIAGGVFWIAGGLSAPLTLTATFTDSAGNPLPQLPVQVQIAGNTTEQKTNGLGKLTVNVSPDSKVFLSVQIQEFAPFEATIAIQNDNVSRTFPLATLEQSKTKTIQFADESGFAINQKISLSVSCSQPGVALEQTQLETDFLGKVELTEPVGCGNLQVTVLGPSEFKTKSYSLDQPHNILYLLGVDTIPDDPPQMQPIRIRIEDESGNLISGIELEVSLYKENVYQKKTKTNTGKARFDDLPAGTYSVNVLDATHQYAGQPVGGIIVSQTAPVGENTVLLSQNVQMQLSAQAVDSDTQLPIPLATIVFKNKDSGAELYRKQTDGLGAAVEFSSTQKVSLKIEAFAENYFSSATTTEQTAGNVKINLSKTTLAQAGKVTVRVLDETGKVVANARVFLRDNETKTIAPYPEKTSDTNGVAVFLGVSAGEWFGYAEKYPASGSSLAQTTDPTIEANFSVTMEIGDSELTINAFSEHGELIPNSIAELRTQDNRLVGEIPLPNGSATFRTKADKRLFVVVKNPQYFAYQTETFQLFKDNQRVINAYLPSRLLGGGPKAVFLGIVDEFNKPVTKLQAGGTYFVHMQLLVPEDAQWQKAGIHFRVGASKTIENDSLMITGVNVGNANMTAGSTYNEPKGNLVDLAAKNLSKGDAKWTEFSWTRPSPRAYNALVKIFVKKNTIPGSPMPIYYRAFAENTSGRVIRDPVDNELGEAYNTGNKQALYANSHAIVSFFEGVDAECINNFCFSNLRVLGLKEGLFLKNQPGIPYDTRVNSPYTVSFILTNNSESNYSGAKLSIRALKNGTENNELKFTGYTITNASQQVFSNASPPDSFIKDIDAGEFKTNTGMQAKIDFLPTTLHSTQIEITLVFENQVVMQKIIDFDTGADKRMNIALDPNFVGPFSPQPITTHITLDDNENSEDNGMDIDGALVTLTIETPDHAKTVSQMTTNPLGKATFNLPSLLPSTKLKFKAEKPGYFSDPVTLIVDANIITFNPAELVSNLKTSVQTEELLSSEATNHIALDLTVTSIRLFGNFKGVLNETQMNNYLQQLKGHVFKANAIETLAILKTALADIPIYQNQKLDATLVLEVQNPAIGKRIPISIPVKINVALTGLPENQTCLTIDDTTWQGSVQDNRITHTFTLTNNCTVEGKPITLSNLASRLKWNGDAVGNVELSLTQGNGGNGSGVNTLLPNDSTVFFDQTKTGDTYYGVLSFTPKSGKLGETAKFDVDFIASASTDAGPKNVSSDPIKAEILIVNLENCLAYSSSSAGLSPDPVVPDEAPAGASGATPQNPFNTTLPNTGASPFNNPFGATANPQGTQPNPFGGTNTGVGTPFFPANETVLPAEKIELQSKQTNANYNFQSKNSISLELASEKPVTALFQAVAGDASEVFVRIPFKGEGNLTIDSSACGNIELEVALCLDDSGCSGGAEGTINLNPDNFNLTQDKRTKTIRITGSDIPGLYGLSVYLRPKGRDYVQVGLIDVTVDPNPEHYFFLDKYQYFIKGLNAKDTGTLTNKRFSSVTIIDAPANNWANLDEPDEEDAFGNMMPLVAAGLLPAMIPPLVDAMSQSHDNAQAAGEDAFGKFKDGQNDTKAAEQKAKELGAQCNPGQNACADMDALKNAIKKVDPLINGTKDAQGVMKGGIASPDMVKKMGEFRTACDAMSGSELSNAINNGVDITPSDGATNPCGGLENSIPSFNTEFKTATDAFGDFKTGAVCGSTTVSAAEKKAGEFGIYFQASGGTNALTSFNQMCTQFKTAEQSAKNAASGFESARQSGQWKDSGSVSSATQSASNGVKNSVLPAHNATGTAINSGNTNLTAAKGKLEGVKTGFDSLAKKRDCAEATMKKIETITQAAAIPGVAPAKVAACKAAFSTLNTSFKEKLLAVDNAIKKGPQSVDETLAKVKEADLTTTIPNLSTETAQAVDKAKVSADTASNATQNLANNTQQLSNDNRGQNSSALGNALAQAAQLGLMSAAMGSMFDTGGDETDPNSLQNQQRIQNPVQVFNIDLKKDSQGIDMDNEGISAEYDPKATKVFGDLKKQTMGVKFENKGVISNAPVYSTANFKATEHVFDPVTRVPIAVPMELFGSGWAMDFLGRTNDYSQKFHLKFLTSDAMSRLPLLQSETFSCSQGALLGRTGKEALPKVKLSWKFKDIPMNMCDAKNPDYKYCDATQFTIMTVQRLHALDEFLIANSGLPCPVNPFEVEINKITTPLSELTGNSFNAADHVSGCWLPHSTELFDGYPALMYFVEGASNVRWTQDIPNMQALQDTLLFDAYLIQDGYTEDFLSDFSKYYSNSNFSDTPAYFNQDGQGKNYNKYFNEGSILFKQKFSDSDQLPTSGLYRVELIAGFGEHWELFDTTGKPVGNVRIDLLAARQTPFNSPFYYLPFDGQVGHEGSQLNRQGYGTGFEVTAQDAFSISRQSAIQTLTSQFSNPIQVAKVTRSTSLDQLNSLSSNRGFILQIDNTGLNTKQIGFTPTIATPVLMKVSGEKTTKPFSAFYTVRENETPVTTGNSMTFWSGAGECRDFSGDSVVSAFQDKPDRKTSQSDRVDAWQSAYAVDWTKAAVNGNVYLKSVFYTPTNSAFALHSQSTSVVFTTADQPSISAVDLQGIQNMPFNRKGQTETDRITALDDLFKLVEAGQVCVTNTGQRTAFWWNPKTLFDQAGNSGASITQTEQGLKASGACIQ